MCIYGIGVPSKKETQCVFMGLVCPHKKGDTVCIYAIGFNPSQIIATIKGIIMANSKRVKSAIPVFLIKTPFD